LIDRLNLIYALQQIFPKIKILKYGRIKKLLLLIIQNRKNSEQFGFDKVWDLFWLGSYSENMKWVFMCVILFSIVFQYFRLLQLYFFHIFYEPAILLYWFSAFQYIYNFLYRDVHFITRLFNNFFWINVRQHRLDFKL